MRNGFPAIVKNKTAGEPIRVWVAGCSTGEEAYSIAICFKEFLGRRQSKRYKYLPPISVNRPLQKQGPGFMLKSEIEGLAPQRLQEFFTKNNGGYQVNKEIRDMCVFAGAQFFKRSSFWQNGFDKLPQCAYLYGALPAKKGTHYFSLCIKPKRIFIAWQIGNDQQCSGPFYYGWKKR